MKIKIAPSILSADFCCLGRELEKVDRAGADLLHIDIMDGHFVPNITIGPQVVKFIRGKTRLPLDVHLMIKEPQKYIDNFISSGSDMITVHIETVNKPMLVRIRKQLEVSRVKLGVSLNPATPIKKLKNILGLVDLVLVMSVNPGFGGQKFIPAVLPKIKELRALFKGDIAVDGGVNDKVAGSLIKAGANILISGSYIFGARNTKLAIERMRNARRAGD